MAEGPDLHVLADGKRIDPVSDRNARYVFTIPANVRSVSLMSRFCIPADRMVPNMRDDRRLGVRVSWIAIRSGNGEIILSADNPALRNGWHDVERLDKSIWRWTDGAATIPWENLASPAVLTVCCSSMDQYPLYDDKLRLVA